jgi:hypothetical protein
MDFEPLFSAPHISRVAFFLYFRKQMKAVPLKGKQMKGLRIEEKRGSDRSWRLSISHLKCVQPTARCARIINEHRKDPPPQ